MFGGLCQVKKKEKAFALKPTGLNKDPGVTSGCLAMFLIDSPNYSWYAHMSMIKI
jgi:hypothetical protein